MSASNNFTLLNEGQAVVATNATAATPLADTANRGLEDVMIYNPGPLLVYARAGDSTVVATANSMPIFPGSTQTFSRSNATHIAFLSSGANQALTVFQGNGQ